MTLVNDNQSDVSIMDSSSEDLLEFDPKETLDEEDIITNHSEAISLFDDFQSSNAQDVWEHMKLHWGFDLNTIKSKMIDFDDFKRIALINYLRRQQQNNLLSDSIKTIEAIPETVNQWNIEENMLPVKRNDRLLWELPNDFDLFGDEDDEESTTQVEIPHTSSSDSQVQALQKEVQELTKRIHFLTKNWDDEQSSSSDKNKSNSNTHHRNGCTYGPGNTKEDRGYFESYSSLSIHREMVLDKPRTSAYRDFIYAAKDKFKGKIVLDVGAGSGILSMFSSEAGAQLVVGIDAAASTVHVARTIVAQNNFTESQIQQLVGKVEDSDLYFENAEKTRVILVPLGSTPPSQAIPFHCDIIVSEWMGYGLFYESMLNTVIHARDRYLVSGGLLIPSKACMQMCAANCSQLLGDWLDIWDDKVYGFNCHLLKPNEKNFLMTPDVAVIPEKLLVSPLLTFLEVDLTTISEKELFNLRRNFTLSCPSTITSIIFSFFCLFEAPGVQTTRLDTSPICIPTHWRQTICHLMTDDMTRLKLPTAFSDPITLDGSVTLSPDSENHRHLSIIMEWEINTTTTPKKKIASAVNVFHLK